MADLEAVVANIVAAVAETLSANRNEAARALIVDTERDQHESAMSKFRPQTRNLADQGAGSHAQDGKYAVFFHNNPHGRIAMMHHIFNWSLGGKLSLAPIGNNVKHVLDIKSASGIWAFDFAQQHDNVQVVGFDKFDNGLEPKNIPRNCTFKVHNPNIFPWPFQQKFDYIHARSLGGCSPTVPSVRYIIDQAFNILTPGGYLELQGTLCHYMSIDGTLDGTAFREYINVQRKRSEDTPVYKKFMQEAGYVDVVEKHFQWPLGDWPRDQQCKEVGKMFRDDVAGRIFARNFLRKDRRKPCERETDLAARASEDLYDPQIHGYVPVLVVYGRKPE